jgi:hypothetical protein
MPVPPPAGTFHARPAKPPLRNAAARFARARHVFARLMDGQSMRGIAAVEALAERLARLDATRRDARNRGRARRGKMRAAKRGPSL